MFDTSTGKFNKKNQTIYPDKEQAKKEQTKKLVDTKVAIKIKPKLLQGFTKSDIDRLLPAIKILHEAKVEYTILSKFLSEFESSMQVLPL